MNKLTDFEYTIDGELLQFKGNTNLKQCNANLPYTKEHIEEYIKCKNDWRYFASNYYYLLNIDVGLIKAEVRDYQEEMIDSYINNRWTIVLAARQVGKSSSTEIFVLWTILFQNDKNIALLAHKADQARDQLRKIKQAFEACPKWLQQGVKIWNVNSIRLENGSMVLAGATSTGAIRGKSISILICDERSAVPNNIWSEFMAAVYPTISSGKDSKVIYLGTPKGMNHFYKDWIDAIEGRSKFYPIRVDWWRDPRKASNPHFKEETLANMERHIFEQEFGLSFHGSLSTLIEPEIVQKLKHLQQLESSSILSDRLKKHIKIYKEPIKGHSYVMGVDSAKMTEDNAGDALGIQVLDVTSFPIEQVATFFAKEGMSYLACPEVIMKLGKYYNNAMPFIENNEIGQEVANITHFDLEYEVFFEKSGLAGFRTTKKTKRLGCDNLKLLIEQQKLILNDFDTISQLSTFVKKKTSFCAESGYQDDLIMALIAALFFLQAGDIGIDLTESKLDLGNKIFDRERDIDQIEEPTFGFIENEFESKSVNDFDWL